MSSRNTPAEALVHLLKRSCSGSDGLSDLDAECITLVLQTLELLVIESPTLVVGQVSAVARFAAAVYCFATFALSTNRFHHVP